MKMKKKKNMKLKPENKSSNIRFVDTPGPGNQRNK